MGIRTRTRTRTRTREGALALSVLAALASAAAAQPGRTPPSPPPGPPYPHAYPGYVMLTPEEREILERGEITDGEAIAGGLAGTFLGLGIGHAVQGRWSDKGWIFTVGEIASVVGFAVGMAECIDEPLEPVDDDTDCGLAVAGAIGVAVFRIWEVIDVWAGPAAHNRRYRALQYRIHGPYQPPPRWSVYAAPTGSRSGTAGLVLRF